MITVSFYTLNKYIFIVSCKIGIFNFSSVLFIRLFNYRALLHVFSVTALNLISLFSYRVLVHVSSVTAVSFISLFSYRGILHFSLQLPQFTSFLSSVIAVYFISLFSYRGILHLPLQQSLLHVSLQQIHACLILPSARLTQQPSGGLQGATNLKTTANNCAQYNGNYTLS
jgi:hypothetical protein